VWDKNGKRLGQIKRQGGGPTVWGAITFLEGARFIAFPPPDEATKAAGLSVWEVATGKIVKTINGPQPDGDYQLNRAQHFTTSSDQSFLVAATGGNRGSRGLEKNLIVYETARWSPLFTKNVPQGISSLCIFGVGEKIAVGTLVSGSLLVMDARSGAITNDIEVFKESPFGTSSLSIACSPDGTSVFAGVRAAVLNGAPSSQQRTWLDSLPVAQVFNVKSATQVAQLSGAQAPIRQAQWDPKNRFVAFVDNAAGLFLWSPWPDGESKRINLPSASLSLAISPDGQRIAVTTDHGVRVYSIN